MTGKPASATDTTTRLAEERTQLAAERTRLAFERTLLAWTRTAIGLITFGFATYQIILRLRGAIPEGKGLFGPRGFGLTMIFIGLVSLLQAVLQYRKEMRALRSRYPEMPGSSALFLAGFVGVLGLFAMAVMLLR